MLADFMSIVPIKFYNASNLIAGFTWRLGNFSAAKKSWPAKTPVT